MTTVNNGPLEMRGKKRKQMEEEAALASKDSGYTWRDYWIDSGKGVAAAALAAASATVLTF